MTPRTKTTLCRTALLLPACVAALVAHAGTYSATLANTVTGQANPLRGFHVWRGEPVAKQVVLDQAPIDQYDRFTWNELEPTLGNYSGIDAVLEPKIAAAAAAGRRFAFRVRAMKGYGDTTSYLPIDTRPPTPGVVPIHQRGFLGDSDRNGSAETFVPDWNDEGLLTAMEGLFAELGRRYANDRRIAWIDIGWYGQWGEWTIDSDVYVGVGAYQDITQANKERVIRAHTNAFPGQQLLAFGLYRNKAALQYAFGLPLARPVGLRFDCFGKPSFFNQWTDRPAEMTLVTERWRVAPVVGESCGESVNTPEAALAMQDQARLFHLASFANGNFYGLHADPVGGPRLQALAKMIGFSLLPTQVVFPDSIASGGTLSLSTRWRNDGLTPLYEAFSLYWQLTPMGGGAPRRLVSALDLRGILPGTEVVHDDNLALPADLPVGGYVLELIAEDALATSPRRPPLRVAAAGQHSDGVLPVGTLAVTASASGDATDGACGSANGVAVTAPPVGALCRAGDAATVIEEATRYTWICRGSNGGRDAACSAPRNSGTPARIDGACGAAHAVASATPPQAGLCAAGVASTPILGAIRYDWMCQGSNGGTSAACFAPTTVAGNEGNELPSGNAHLTTNAGVTVRIVDNGGAGSTLQLSGAGSSTLQFGSGTLVVETRADTRLRILRGSDARLAIGGDEGDWRLRASASGQVLAIAGTTSLQATSADTLVDVRFRQGRLTRMAGVTGSVALPGGANLFAGEKAEFAAGGELVAHALGSLDGNAGAAGDPLAPASLGLTMVAGVPRLSGTPARLVAHGGGSLEQCIARAAAALGLVAGAQTPQGILRLFSPDGRAYAAWPVGALTVTTAADGFAVTADGLARFNVCGLAITLAPAPADPADLLHTIVAAQPGAHVEVTTDGIWRVRVDNRVLHAFRPDWRLLAAVSPGFSADAGNLAFTAGIGERSLLLPALADRARLLDAARTLDPSATLQTGLSGESSLVIGGHVYRLLPEMNTVGVPLAHAGNAYWVEDGRVLLNLGDGRAQAMRLY